MKIILLKDVTKLGKKYDTKTVSDGYALNLLIPRGLAVIATPAIIKKFERERIFSESERKIQEELSVKSINSLSDVTIVITGKSNDNGHLFAGVHKEEIAKEIENQKNIKIDPSFIRLDHPIKKTGKHDIEIHGAGKTVKISLII